MSAEELSIQQTIDIGSGGSARDVYQIGHVDSLTLHAAAACDRASTRFEGHIRNFIESYVGSDDRPVLFGGRQPELRALDAWLSDTSAKPYGLICARAGIGKSALLAHWVLSLNSPAAVDSTHIIYFPVTGLCGAFSGNGFVRR